ncbi:collagenase-like protease [Candidatus Fermentibacteria bacterium]|nr:MAG: collagenase-like protease [Candidatus Fermentibacteria bacterium]
MVPAGSFETLNAAINAGASSVYFGVGSLNMRSRSANFQPEDLPSIIGICRRNGVRSYLTLNTIMYDEDMENARTLCDLSLSCGLSAVIATDISVIEYARSIGLEVHISTQANISNIGAVRFYSRYADIVVLARELSLDQIEHICSAIKNENICGPSGELLRVEAFVHGAMCVAVSGKCYMSLAHYNSSANRGSCLQTCRRRYRVTDEETGEELIVDNRFVMSPSDLCTIGMLDRLIESGVTVLKIEGRARGPEYVDTVTRAYREAVELIASGKYSQNDRLRLRGELEKVFNRGFWDNGYYMGNELGEWAGLYGSCATTRKIKVGRVVNFFHKPMVVEVLLESGEITLGAEIAFTGPTTGIVYAKADSIMDDSCKAVSKLTKGMNGTIKMNEAVRRNDLVFVIEPR